MPSVYVMYIWASQTRTYINELLVRPSPQDLLHKHEQNMIHYTRLWCGQPLLFTDRSWSSMHLQLECVRIDFSLWYVRELKNCWKCQFFGIILSHIPDGKIMERNIWWRLSDYDIIFIRAAKTRLAYIDIFFKEIGNIQSSWLKYFLNVTQRKYSYKLSINTEIHINMYV